MKLPKNLFTPFSTYLLESSRAADAYEFLELVTEIKGFNMELEKWKKNEHDIKNVVITYHLYENLYSRLKVPLASK
jgi:hypothetical protein